jgi:hypothetical protein
VIDDAIAEEAAAMKAFAKASAQEIKASLKVRAARKRLMDARGATSQQEFDPL